MQLLRRLALKFWCVILMFILYGIIGKKLFWLKSRRGLYFICLKYNFSGICCSKEDEKRTLVTFLENEIKLTEQCLLANPKSYGAWHHRYWTLEHHPKPNWQKEFDLCNQYLKMDDRNCKSALIFFWQ